MQGTRNGISTSFPACTEVKNHKSLKIIELTVRASTEKDDVVWEPFGGLRPSAMILCYLGSRYHGAEIIQEFYGAAVE